MLAACGGSDSSAKSATSSTRVKPTSTSAVSAPAARKQAIAAYNAMWSDMAAAAETADYQSPRLAEHADSDALSQLVRGLYANKQHGIVVKGDPRTSPEVTSATPAEDPTVVMIRDCLDGTRWLNYVEQTGKLENDTPGSRHATTATVRRDGSSWKVTDLAVGADGSC
jgi:hypothetical protein